MTIEHDGKLEAGIAMTAAQHQRNIARFPKGSCMPDRLLYTGRNVITPEDTANYALSLSGTVHGNGDFVSAFLANVSDEVSPM